MIINLPIWMTWGNPPTSRSRRESISSKMESSVPRWRHGAAMGGFFDRRIFTTSPNRCWLNIYWLVVLTILKNISQWEGLSHILWEIKNVWNHQPVYVSSFCFGLRLNYSLLLPTSVKFLIVGASTHCFWQASAHGESSSLSGSSWRFQIYPRWKIQIWFWVTYCGSSHVQGWTIQIY